MKKNHRFVLLSFFLFIILIILNIKKHYSFCPDKVEILSVDTSEGQHFRAEIVLDPLRDRYITAIEGFGRQAATEAKKMFEAFLETDLKNMIITLDGPIQEKLSVWRVLRKKETPQDTTMQLLFTAQCSHN